MIILRKDAGIPQYFSIFLCLRSSVSQYLSRSARLSISVSCTQSTVSQYLCPSAKHSISVSFSVWRSTVSQYLNLSPSGEAQYLSIFLCLAKLSISVSQYLCLLKTTVSQYLSLKLSISVSFGPLHSISSFGPNLSTQLHV